MLIPLLAHAHPGIEAREYLGHALQSPLGAWDHILASVLLTAGLVSLVSRSAGKFVRRLGALLAFAGAALLILV